MNPLGAMGLTVDDGAALRRAVRLLESPTLAARVTAAVGKPLQYAIEALPTGSSRIITNATRSALHKALTIAASSLDTGRSAASERVHMAAVMAAGLIGGAFGLPALMIELPTTTVVMLRSILDIARSEGEDLDDHETRLSCMEVFALGAPAANDDTAESAYFTMRSALATAVTEAAAHVSRHGLASGSAPVLVKFLSKVGARFGVVVSEKVAVQAVPVIGAIGGAGINGLFMKHFQDVARGHFIIRRLERDYGRTVVRAAYERTLNATPERRSQPL
ncbi:MAG TPA: EcsC family protein [Alphaproteobacteria bacterium]